MNERLSELKSWLLSYSYPLKILEKIFLMLKCKDLALKKEEIVIPFV